MEESAIQRRRPTHLIPPPLEGPGIRTYIIASLSVFIACSAIALWVWNSARHSEKRNLQEGLAYSTTLVQEAVQNRLRAYEELTRGAGAFAGTETDTITQTTWHSYVGNIDLSKNYPGVRSVGFAPYVNHGQWDQFMATLPAKGVENFSLSPVSDNDWRVPVTFLSTDKPRAVVLGTDLFAEPVRRSSLELARDTGRLVLSNRVIPFIYGNNQQEAGVYIFVPVYGPGPVPATKEARQAALRGFSFSFLRTKDLFNGLFQSLPVPANEYALQFFDGAPQASNLLYQSATADTLKKADGTVTVSRPTSVDDRQWTLVLYLSHSLLSSNQQRLKPVSILIYGIAFSTLLSGLLLIIMISRARSITYEKQTEVQAAKDELLSLASHQLRTPATGVKQFVGMLLEGYAGKLTKEQLTMLQKAYRSNERQLEIINDILHVTRLDSGRIVLNKQRIELNQLIRSIIDEQRSTLAERRQKISFRSSAKKIYIMADDQYLSMALDNLINNASKYSRSGQRISVRVYQHRSSVSIHVIDHGVGIHAEDLHKLFKKFSRIHNDLSVEAGGSGIGLYLCQEIIRLHEGTIEVETAPERGSSFVVHLPRS